MAGLDFLSDIFRVIKAKQEVFRSVKEGVKRGMNFDQDKFNSLPLFYRTMVLNDLAVENKERYLEPISIPKRVHQRLEGLVDSPILTELLEDIEKRKKESLSGQELKEIIGNQNLKDEMFSSFKLKSAYKGELALLNYNCDLAEAQAGLHKTFSSMYIAGFNPEKSLIEVNGAFINFSSLLKEALSGNSNLVAHRRELQNIISNARPLSPLAKKTLEVVLLSTLFKDFRVSEEYFSLKMNRTRELMGIDKNLGLAYFTFVPYTSAIIKSLEWNFLENQHIDLNPNCHCVNIFWKHDLEAYKSILSNLKVFERPKKSAIVTSAYSAPPLQKPLVETPPYSLLLTQAITQTEDHGTFTEEMEARIGYFVGDAVSSGLSWDSLDTLSASLRGFNLGKKMKPHDIRLRPTDVKVRNFFDDLTINYLKKKVVPTVNELKELYDKA